MSTDAQALIRKTWDTFDTGDEAGFLECFAPDWVEHYGTMTATVEDALGALRRYAGELTDRETILEQVVVQGEWAAVRTTRHATHRASGKPVHVHEISVHRIEDGRLAESWTESSSPSVLDQIGA